MRGKQRFLPGFTLIELMAACVLASIAVLGIVSLLSLSFADWKTSREIASLQEDLNQTSYLIKGVLEEAGSQSIPAGSTPAGSRIQAACGSSWQKEFYQSGNQLIYKNDKTGATEVLIETLQSVLFVQGTNSVTVTLAVASGARNLTNTFSIYLRNKGGG